MSVTSKEFKFDTLDSVPTDEINLDIAENLDPPKTCGYWILSKLGWSILPFYVPSHFVKKKDLFSTEETHELNFIERLFVCINDSKSSIVGSIIGVLVMSVIFLNLVVGIVITVPEFRNELVTDCPGFEVCSNDSLICPDMIICEPKESSVLRLVDMACVSIFTIDFGARVLLCCFVRPENVRLLGIVPKNWDKEECERMLRAGIDDTPDTYPVYSFWYRPVRYCLLIKNIIDMLSIIPFYIELSGTGVSLSFVRVLRLFRILRALKLQGGGVVRVMIRAMKDSFEPLLLLMASSALIVLIFGSVAYNLEGGEYQYRCDWDSGFDGSTLADGGSCHGGYTRPNVADTAIEFTPFHSTLSGMYWACITMTTVGYGDMYPTSVSGRLLAVLCAFCGLVLMAMPISILGNNFSNEYKKYKDTMQAEHEYHIKREHDLNKLRRSRRAQSLVSSKSISITSTSSRNIGSGSETDYPNASEAQDSSPVPVATAVRVSCKSNITLDQAKELESSLQARVRSNMMDETGAASLLVETFRYLESTIEERDRAQKALAAMVQKLQDAAQAASSFKGQDDKMLNS